MLLDEAMPADTNVTQTVAGMQLKYLNFCIELHRMWNIKCKIIPLIIGATGIVTKVLRENVEAITTHH